MDFTLAKSLVLALILILVFLQSFSFYRTDREEFDSGVIPETFENVEIPKDEKFLYPEKEENIVPINLEEVFEKRRIIMKRGCKFLKHIESLMTDPKSTFEELLKFHYFIHNTSAGIEQHQKLMNKEECDTTHPVQSSVRVIGSPFDIMICLPLKCGSSNWERGMNVLQERIDGNYDAVPENYHQPELFEYLKVLDMTKFNPEHSKHLEFTRQRKGSYKVANARNPFSRLYSAWHDKSRTHLFLNGSVDIKSIRGLENITDDEVTWKIRQKLERQLLDHTIQFHKPYYPGIKPFEKEPQVGVNYTFGAFAEYIAANLGDSKMNTHWRTFKLMCLPCAVEYDYITHLEFSSIESKYLLEKMKVNNLTHIPGKYSWSPAERDEEHWSSIPRRTVENIYKHYYADFLLFGYSPQEVLGYIRASNKTGDSASEWQINESRRNLVEHSIKYHKYGNEDFICTKPK